MQLSKEHQYVAFDESELSYFYKMCRNINTLPSVADGWTTNKRTYINVNYLRRNMRLYVLSDFNLGQKGNFINDLRKLLECTECTECTEYS